jgi:hypothetical protein
MQNSHKINKNKNQNCSYDNCNTRPQNFYKSDLDKNAEEINDNISENANSVQTSYKYRKNKKGQNSISSQEQKENFHYHDNYLENDYDLSYEMSDNDNLICPNCINCTLIEEKRKRENLNNMRDRDIRNNDYEKENMNALIDKNRNYDRDLINEKRRQREKNINNAYQNLAKINAGMSNKDKLIQLNENSRNPLNEGYPDYQYQKFQDEYARRQKMINDNINKYYPNINKERPEISSYYDNYVNNPNLAKNKNNTLFDINGRDYDKNKNNDKNEYLRILEQQINEKNELKRREKEEERRRGQRQYEEMQKELKREEQERYLKEQRQKEELIRGNLELINQKNQLKIKELEEKLKYRELCDKQNDDYLKELEKQKIEKERLKDELYNQNKNEYEIRQKNKLLEKERNKIYYDSNEYDYPKRKYDRENDDEYKRPEIRDKYDRQYEKNKYKNDQENNDYKDYRDKNRGHIKVKEKMGRCCRCHRIFPRKLLSINKYFYKENRV